MHLLNWRPRLSINLLSRQNRNTFAINGAESEPIRIPMLKRRLPYSSRASDDEETS